MTPTEILEKTFAESASDKLPALADEQLQQLQTIIAYAEAQRAVLAALITSLVKKIEVPAQDVRIHKAELAGGYSGRTYDTKFVTPFIARHFPRYAMKSGSGWLTRSIEQSHPFTLEFPGMIQNRKVKTAFLQILHDLETKTQSPSSHLTAIFVLLRRQAKASEIAFSSVDIRNRVSVQAVVTALKDHFFFNYRERGASRLPVIAIHSIYSLLIIHNERFRGKILLPLKSHTTSDIKSGGIGDVEIVDSEGAFFEAIEVKHRKPITPRLVEDSFEKFRTHPVNRFYLLTTAYPNISDEAEVWALVQKILRQHGCETIPNDAMMTLKYYLRLAGDPAAFVAAYSEALKREYGAITDLKESHLRRWSRILKENGWGE